MPFQCATNAVARSAYVSACVAGCFFSSLLTVNLREQAAAEAEFRVITALAKYQKAYAGDVTAISGWAAGKLFADALESQREARARFLESQRAMVDSYMALLDRMDPGKSSE